MSKVMNKTINEQIALISEAKNQKNWFFNNYSYYSNREVLEIGILDEEELDSAFSHSTVISFESKGIRFYEENSIVSYASSLVNKNKRQTKNKNAISKEELFDKKIWRTKDVASYLSCSVSHIHNLNSKKQIPSVKKGKFLYFIPDVIQDWLLLGGS